MTVVVVGGIVTDVVARLQAPGPLETGGDTPAVIRISGGGSGASLLAARLAGATAEESLRAAARLGARAVTRLGARP
jgi:hypothetical protein